MDREGERHVEALDALRRITVTDDAPERQIVRLLETGMAAVDARSALVLTGSGSSERVVAISGSPVSGVEVGDQIADHRIDQVMSRRASVASLGGGRATPERGPAGLGPGAMVFSPMWVDGEVAGVVALVTDGRHPPFSSWSLALVDLVADGVARVLERGGHLGAVAEPEVSSAQAMLDLIPDSVVRLSRSGQPVGTLSEDEGQRGDDPLVALIGGDDCTVERLRTGIAQALAQGALHTVEFSVDRGEPARRVEARIVPAGDDEVLCIARDVTERHRAARQASVFESIARNEPVEAAVEGVRKLLAEQLGRATVLVLAVADQHLTLIGADPDDPCARWYADLPLDCANPYGQAVATGERVVVADVGRDARFSRGVVPDQGHGSLVVHPVRSSRYGRVLGLVVVAGPDPSVSPVGHEVDASTMALVTVAMEREAVTRLLAHDATHDPLTGVGNRAALLDRLQLVLARARRSGDPVAVLFCDLDGFKAVNDQHGHLGGDGVLREVARRISAAVRPSDTVCRAGGDEFVVVCEDLTDPAEAEQIARRVVDAVTAAPIPVNDAEARIGVSVGVALADPALDGPDRVLRRADLDMYRNKQRGRR